MNLLSLVAGLQSSLWWPDSVRTRKVLSVLLYCSNSNPFKVCLHNKPSSYLSFLEYYNCLLWLPCVAARLAFSFLGSHFYSWLYIGHCISNSGASFVSGKIFTVMVSVELSYLSDALTWKLYSPGVAVKFTLKIYY